VLRLDVEVVAMSESPYLMSNAHPGVMAANARQVRDGLLGLGITSDDIARFLELLTDPDTIIGTSVLITAWGQRVK
jgi:hypothetical protein